MLTTLRDAQDNRLACCEWWLVNERGTWTPWGEYIWVSQLEIAPGKGTKTLYQTLIQKIAQTAPKAKGAYWEPRDSTRSQLHG